MPTDARPKVVILANCQGAPLADLLTLFLDVNVLSVIAVHRSQAISDAEFEQLFGKSDFILSQEIKGSRYSSWLRSDELKKRCPEKLLFWQNLHFSGYNPELTYLRSQPGMHLRGPLGDYHIREIVEGCQDGRTVAQICNALRDPEINQTRYVNAAQDALSELRRRESNTVTPIADFIAEFHTKRRLFYTFNHPLNVALFRIVIGLGRAMGRRPLQPYRADIFPERLNQISIPLNAGVLRQMGSRISNWPVYLGYRGETDGAGQFKWTRERRFYSPEEITECFSRLYRSAGTDALNLI